MARELGNLCYNVPGESIYGEITLNSIRQLTQYFSFPDDDWIHIVDIGSGAGYMLCNFAQCLLELGSERKIHLTGYEISAERARLSREIIPQLLEKDCKDMIEWEIYQADIQKQTMLPRTVTHAVSFDKTFTPALLAHMEKLQRSCPSLTNVVSNHKYPEKYWDLVARVPCKLRGSSQV